MTVLSRDDVRMTSELSSGVAILVTQFVWPLSSPRKERDSDIVLY